MASPILVLGVPRSGSTWLAESLSFADRVRYVHEPDNEGLSLAGYAAKAGLHRYPWFASGEQHAPYQRLFVLALQGRLLASRGRTNEFLMRLYGQTTARVVEQLALNLGRHRPGASAQLPALWRGTRPSALPGRPLVKSVHAALALPWLMEQVQPVQPFAPVVVVRHPASVVSSYLKLNMPDADRFLDRVPALREGPLKPYVEALDALDEPLARMGAQVGIFYHLLDASTRAHQVDVHRHETLCEDPVERLHGLYQRLELPWSPAVQQAIEAHNTAGSGFATRRVAADQINVWKKRLKPDQIEAIAQGYRILPNRFYPPF